MSIRVVILDDEPRAIELLNHYISRIDQLEVVQTFRNPLKAFQYLNSEEVDLLFLDINMPQLSGLDLFKNLQNAPKVIFTTAHAKYAIDGFDLEAIDYLLKPISFSRFLKAYHKLENLYNITDIVNLGPTDSVFIKCGVSEHKILWRDIKYLEKSENYVIYHLTSGKRFNEQSHT